jgi:uncharacterized protein (DUF1015 family)
MTQRETPAMPLIAPFAGLRPAPGRAAELLAPPYDVLGTDEARALAAGRPWSFLHLSRPEIDLPPGVDPQAPASYAQAAARFARMRGAGLLVRDQQPCYYCYRLSYGAQVQTGLVVAASLAAYRAGRIRRHEVTLADKEDDRVRQIAALGAQAGPAYLIHRPSPAIDDTLAEIARTAPALDGSIADGTWDGVRHQLWVVSDQGAIERLTAGFEAQRRLYIADGHHRTAAAARIGAARQAANPGHTGSEAYNRFLAVSFPADQLRVLAVNRLARDLQGRDAATFLRQLGECGALVPSAAPVMPGRRGEFGLYLDRAWYRLTLDHPDHPPSAAPRQDPAARLDVRLLQDQVLAPLLGIADPRQDPRIGFVGGIRGLPGLMQQVDGGAWRLGFSLFPTALADLLALAEAGAVMPPKCTWFEPKLADGVVSLVLD